MHGLQRRIRGTINDGCLGLHQSDTLMFDMNSINYTKTNIDYLLFEQ